MKNESENYKEALSRINDVKDKNGSKLDFACLRLDNDEFAEILSKIHETLPDLEELNLFNNKLSRLPPEIKKLKKLQKLLLAKNELSSLPNEIGKLKNLQVLNLKNNQLSQLPPTIGKLKNLQVLNLKNNQLPNLPPEIGNIKNLQKLFLTKNKLLELPTEIGKLKKLQVLNLNKNQLSNLPSTIGKLRNLKILNLSENQFSQIPVKIFKLNGLKELHLSFNQLSDLPIKIVKLQNLQGLFLNNNQLSTIPDSITQLTSIRSLNLKNNSLSQETMHFLSASFDHNVVSCDINSNYVSPFYKDILAKLYLDKSEAIANQIEALDPSWEFVDGSEVAENAETTIEEIKKGDIPDFDGSKMQEAERKIKENTIIATEAIIDFLDKIPLHGSSDANAMYYEAAKYLLDLVLGNDMPEVEKKSTLYKIAKALGACETPVRDRLVQAYIDKHRTSDPKPEGYHSQIARQAIESEIVDKLKQKKDANEELILSKAEEIEQIHGLINAIFMKGASTHQDNKCKVSFIPNEQPERLPSITLNSLYAFQIVSEELAEEFAKLCCKTDGRGNLLKNEKGEYLFSIKKYTNIVENYYNKALGVNSPRDIAIANYIERIELIAKKSELGILHYDNDEAISLLRFKNQESELRLQLSVVPDSEVKNVADKYFEVQKGKITDLAKSLENAANETEDPTNEWNRLTNAPKTKKSKKRKSPTPISRDKRKKKMKF